jgi:hypothetical protein
MKESVHLEEISEKIRRGVPVGIEEAIAAIEYQRARKLAREAEIKANRWWKRLGRWISTLKR